MDWLMHSQQKLVAATLEQGIRPQLVRQWQACRLEIWPAPNKRYAADWVDTTAQLDSFRASYVGLKLVLVWWLVKKWYG
jgi:uncharacterized lipoprotein YmbA